MQLLSHVTSLATAGIDAHICASAAPSVLSLVRGILQGHLVGHIKDIGHDPTKPTTRLYATHEAQPFHNDSSDIVGYGVAILSYSSSNHA